MTTSLQRLFLFAGEQSGDLHGSHLLEKLKSQWPDCHFTGVGGELMRSKGLDVVMEMEKFAVMGFVDVFASLPRLVRQFYTVRSQILKTSPDAVILIDYPDFNLRLAKSLRKAGYQGKLVHYIAPSVWAWRQKRAQRMARDLNLLLTIYPFESNYFDQKALKVDFVGNPLKEYIDHYTYKNDWKAVLDLPSQAEWIALFPGSRRSEILKNLPLQLQAALELKARFPKVCFALSIANDHYRDLILQIITHSTLVLNRDIFLIPKTYTYELMKEAKSAIAKSGTVTLELALHRCPTVVLYSLGVNRYIAKYIVRLKLPHYCIVNILAQDCVFPELIEKEPTPELIVQHTQALYEESSAREACLKGCDKVIEMLKDKQASRHALQSIKTLFT